MKNTNLITIGIPAFNEEDNISFLINDLLNQTEFNNLVEKIVISSDGSSDKTVQIIKSFKNNKIKIIDNKSRQGLAIMLNCIIARTNSKVLILINADTRISDRNFIKKISEPILKNKSDLTAPHVIESMPTTRFEKVLFTSMRIKDIAFFNFKNGNNVYTCHGQARAFSKNLYKSIEFKASVGEDAYSYFYCIVNGFRYKYLNNIDVIYKLPSNVVDHKKQSVRFLQSKQLLEKEFNSDFVKNEYKIPKVVIFKSIFEVFLDSPLNTILYIVSFLYTKFNSLFAKKIADTWDISKSSKKMSA